MTSFNDLIDRSALAIDDENHAKFDRENICAWLNDAIRDYSQHFPRIETQTISCGTADHDYDLNSDFLSVLSVEYPTGEDPPAYLSRLAHTHPDFWTGSLSLSKGTLPKGSKGWYDFRARGDDETAGELLVAADTAVGESIKVQYHALHTQAANPGLPTEDITVPAIHQPLLVKYVQWQATQQLLFAEQQSPTSNSSLLMAQLSQNARRLESAYHTAVKQALYAADGHSQPAPWVQSGDLHAPIY